MVSIIVVAIVALLAGYIWGRKKGWNKAVSYINPDQISKRQDNLQHILEYLSFHDTITNDEVERLLSVSDATAERYLAYLEQEGRIVQQGKAGRYVKYTLK